MANVQDFVKNTDCLSDMWCCGKSVRLLLFVKEVIVLDGIISFKPRHIFRTVATHSLMFTYVQLCPELRLLLELLSLWSRSHCHIHS